MCDYNGRSAAILRMPGGARPVSLAWGGDGMDVLHVLCEGGGIFKRRMKAAGCSVEAPMPQVRQGAG